MASSSSFLSLTNPSIISSHSYFEEESNNSFTASLQTPILIKDLPSTNPAYKGVADKKEFSEFFPSRCCISPSHIHKQLLFANITSSSQSDDHESIIPLAIKQQRSRSLCDPDKIDIDFNKKERHSLDSSLGDGVRCRFSSPKGILKTTSNECNSDLSSILKRKEDSTKCNPTTFENAYPLKSILKCNKQRINLESSSILKHSKSLDNDALTFMDTNTSEDNEESQTYLTPSLRDFNHFPHGILKATKATSNQNLNTPKGILKNRANSYDDDVTVHNTNTLQDTCDDESERNACNRRSILKNSIQ